MIQLYLSYTNLRKTLNLNLNTGYIKMLKKKKAGNSLHNIHVCIYEYYDIFEYLLPAKDIYIKNYGHV